MSGHHCSLSYAPAINCIQLWQITFWHVVTNNVLISVFKRTTFTNTHTLDQILQLQAACATNISVFSTVMQLHHLQYCRGRREYTLTDGFIIIISCICVRTHARKPLSLRFHIKLFYSKNHSNSNQTFTYRCCMHKETKHNGRSLGDILF